MKRGEKDKKNTPKRDRRETNKTLPKMYKYKDIINRLNSQK